MRASLRGLPSSVWALGLASMFMDCSSELVHGLLPLYLTTAMGASVATVGVLEGLAEAIAAVVKVFSGTLSDWLGKRKVLVVAGYSLAALTKPVFPLAPSIGWVFAARFIDRVGKGIRGAPRDALIADVTPPEKRGAAYGLRQSLDSAGAFAGPALAVLAMACLADNIRLVLWIAVLPACIAAALPAFCVSEPGAHVDRPVARLRLSREALRALQSRYWTVILVGVVLSLARFSEAFLLLRAQNSGLPIRYAPLVMIVMNLVYAGTAYPAGIAADRLSRRTLMGLGVGVLVVADAVLAVASTPAVLFLGTALWGLHMGVTQGLLSKWVADTAPVEMRGTAFGIFNLATAAALLAASALAGALWTLLGPQATFLAGGTFAVLALLGLPFLHGEEPS